MVDGEHVLRLWQQSQDHKRVLADGDQAQYGRMGA